LIKDHIVVIVGVQNLGISFDKTGTRIPNYEAWELSKSSKLNFSEWPQSSYDFGDKVDV
jgi:hypothetical protein